MANFTNISNIIRGDSQLFLIPITSNNTPVNIVGFEVFFTVNPNNNPSDDSTAIIEKSYTVAPGTVTQVFNGITYTIDPTQGMAYFMLSNSDTQSLVPGGYFYDFQLKDLNGSITSKQQGNFTIIADITRRIV